MAREILGNFAYSTLAAGITNVAGSLTVQAGHGARFPTITAPDQGHLVLEDVAGNREICTITHAAASDTITLTARGQEGTAARAWSSGDTVEIRLTAGSLGMLDNSAAIAAATSKATPVGADKFGIWDSVSGVLNGLTCANLKATLKTYFDGIYGPSNRNDFRLTLTSGLPVTTADVIGAGTLYCSPITGNKIALYDGASWVTRASSEFSIALSGLTANRPYDVYCYDNAGTPTLELLAWTNDTTRATGLTTFDGVLVKNGTATRRYLGTIYTTGTTTTEDSAAKRFVWNYYNRSLRKMYVGDSTNTWTYSNGAAFQQANNSAANQLDFVIGVSEDVVDARVNAFAINSTTTARQVSVGIGLDGLTVTAPATGSTLVTSYAASTLMAAYRDTVAAGRHYLTRLERGDGTDTQTWWGDNGGTVFQSSINGGIWA